MKLRNKKTGEIKDWSFAMLQNIAQTTERKHYASLAELNEEWEDYEESKGKWFISNNGQIHNDEEHERFREEREQIGNYFETKKEAEKAVEKLKAWKRLKDKGFEITGWDNTIGDDYYKPAQIVIRLNGKPEWDEYDNINDIKGELDLLFGGEE